MRSSSQVDFLQLDLRRHEQAAKSVPYISFMLTHAALVLFLVAVFFVDRLVSMPAMDLPVKILLVCLGVLLVAAEWVYSIAISRRWKQDVRVLMQLEAAQRQREAEEQLRRQDEIIAAEQLRNRVLQADHQRLRSQQGQGGFGPVRSIRPVNPPAPPESYRPPAFPPFPSFEPRRNASGNPPSDHGNPRSSG